MAPTKASTKVKLPKKVAEVRRKTVNASKSKETETNNNTKKKESTTRAAREETGVRKTKENRRPQAELQKSRHEPTAEEIFRKAKKYHQLKHEVLAPFLTRLLIERKWEELSENLGNEITIMEDNDADAVLGDEDEGEGVEANNTSYQEDWREGEGENPGPSRGNR